MRQLAPSSGVAASKHIIFAFLEITVFRGLRNAAIFAPFKRHRQQTHGREVYELHVVVMANSQDDLAGFIQPELWEPLPDDGGRIWTDDYANLLSILK